MARPEKVAVVEEVRDRMSASTATVLTEYRGLTVGELQELRAKLRESEAEYRVVKNTLTRRAAAAAGLEVPDELLVGPTAVTFCAGDPVAVAKILRAFSREHPSLVIKGGILDGNLLDAEETLRLADLESREELLARLAGLLGTVLAQPARLAQASLSKFARLLAAYTEQRESAGETAAPPAEAPQAADEPEAAQPEPAAEADEPEADGAETAEAEA